MAVYSHVITRDVTRDELIEATRPVYDGALTAAHDLMQSDLGETIQVCERTQPGDVEFEQTDVLKIGSRVQYS